MMFTLSTLLLAENVLSLDVPVIPTAQDQNLRGNLLEKSLKKEGTEEKLEGALNLSATIAAPALSMAEQEKLLVGKKIDESVDPNVTDPELVKVEKLLEHRIADTVIDTVSELKKKAEAGEEVSVEEEQQKLGQRITAKVLAMFENQPEEEREKLEKTIEGAYEKLLNKEAVTEAATEAATDAATGASTEAATTEEAATEAATGPSTEATAEEAATEAAIGNIKDCNAACERVGQGSLVAYPGDDCYFCNCANDRGIKMRVAEGTYWSDGVKTGQCGSRSSTANHLTYEMSGEVVGSRLLEQKNQKRRLFSEFGIEAFFQMNFGYYHNEEDGPFNIASAIAGSIIKALTSFKH